MKKFSSTVIILMLALVASAQKEGLNSIRKESIQSHMTFFASDEMQGRETGTSANDASALYLKTNLMRMGVKGIPGTGDYFQDIPMHRISTKNHLQVNGGTETFSTDSVVLFVPPVQSVENSAKVVFAGYGHFDNKSGYNDFKDVDIKDKIVIIMTGTPERVKNGKAASGVFDNSEQQKFTAVFMRGPKALLMVYSPHSDYKDPYKSGLAEMIGGENVSVEGKPMQSIPFQLGFISQYTANMLLRSSGQDLRMLEEKILSTGQPASFEIEGATATLTSSLVNDSFKARNVIGIIEGSDPVLKNESIIYTAHFDHTGVDAGKVFNGADDNASGSVALLEMAGAFMSLKKKPARTIIFAWVNGEEKGLLGSQYYAENPVFPLEKTILNINLDMVGRSKLPSDTGRIFGTELSVTGEGELELYSGHESTVLDRLVDESASQAGIKLIDKGKDLEWGGSDHMSFRSKGVTALMFHSGIHADLHTERDDIGRIDFGKMEKSSKMCFLLGYKVANLKERFPLDKKQ